MKWHIFLVSVAVRILAEWSDAVLFLEAFSQQPMRVEILWDMVQCHSDSQCYVGVQCRDIEGGGTAFLSDVWNHSPNDRSYHRMSEPSVTLMWEPQNLTLKRWCSPTLFISSIFSQIIQVDAQFCLNIFIYVSSLHVLGTQVPIIRRKSLYLCDTGICHSWMGGI